MLTDWLLIQKMKSIHSINTYKCHTTKIKMMLFIQFLQTNYKEEKKRIIMPTE